MKKIISVFLIICFTFQVVAKNNSKQYDALLNDLFEKDSPGGVALVVKEGKIIYRKAFGFANLELGVKMKPENVFRIGSITKQFTASAIMQLVEQGKIKLDDDITKYIKDYPTHGYTITIENLLTHTSGIKSYTGMKKWTPEVRKQKFTPLEMIDFFKSEAMDFAPGEKFKYDNSGYFLLGYIIEKASGQTYAEYIKDHIFKPLGMNHSYYGGNSPIIKNRVAGYNKVEDNYVNDEFLSMTQPYAAGSLLSTVDDLSTWYAAVMSDKVITKASREKAQTAFTLNDGSHTDYGFGWTIGNINGSPMISHNGGINGFLSASNYLPKEKVFVAILSNCMCHYPGDVATKIAAIAIGKPYNWKQTSLTEDELKAYVAVYSSKSDGERVITFDEGKLYSMRTGGSKHELLPYAKDKFFIDDDTVSLEFLRDVDNAISGVVLKSTRSDKLWQRTDKPIPTITKIEVDDEIFQKYVGEYALTENFHLKIFKQERKMYTQATGQQKIEIVGTAKHNFSLIGVDAQLTFNFDENDKVTSVTLHQNGDHEAKRIE
jgi:CubicO group peptidase (beta-lactamase class C family)